METLVSVILPFVTFMMLINAIAKILGGSTGKIAATGFIGFLILKTFSTKLDKYIEEYRNHLNK